jgi:hypothetical protein
MSIKDDISWFKTQFQLEIVAAIENTPFRLELLIAIALQETGYLWRNIYKRESVARTLELCVGDTIGAPNRTAFPVDKAALEANSVPKGKEMFQIARQALEDIALYNNDFKVAARNPDRFCRGFGIFQYDLQFFQTNPDYFLEKRWYEFDQCLARCVEELKSKLISTYGRDKTSLTDQEMVYVAIAYNRGSVDFSRGFKQGFKDSSGKYYGEYIWEYLQLAKGSSSSTQQYRVNARSGLRLRSGPGTNFDTIELLPLGRLVFVGKRQGEWVEVDLQGDGVIDGFAFASYLVPS